MLRMWSPPLIEVAKQTGVYLVGLRTKFHHRIVLLIISDLIGQWGGHFCQLIFFLADEEATLQIWPLMKKVKFFGTQNAPMNGRSAQTRYDVV